MAFTVVIAASALGEHGLRRSVQARLAQSIEQREALAEQVAGLYLDVEQIKSDLTLEQVRSGSLARRLDERTAALEKSMARLQAESQTVAELEQRLTVMAQQMGQIQGELAMALQAAPARAKAGTVELERVVVSDSGSSVEGRIVSVHQDWNFVVIDLGWDAVRIGDTVSIYRNNQLTAKARVERVQAGVAAATLLPEWKAAEVQVNDTARLL